MLDAEALARSLQAGQSITVNVKGTPIKVLPEETQVRMRAREGLSMADADGVVVGIDTEWTPELAREGLARDIVRQVQDTRGKAGFKIEDRITLTYQADEALSAIFEGLGKYIAAETLAVEMQAGAPPEGSHVESFKVDEKKDHRRRRARRMTRPYNAKQTPGFSGRGTFACALWDVEDAPGPVKSLNLTPELGHAG